MVAATVANVNRDKKKKSTPYKWSDFFPRSIRARRQTWQEQLKIVEMLNAAFGGNDLRKKG